MVCSQSDRASLGQLAMAAAGSTVFSLRSFLFPRPDHLPDIYRFTGFGAIAQELVNRHNALTGNNSLRRNAEYCAYPAGISTVKFQLRGGAKSTCPPSDKIPDTCLPAEMLVPGPVPAPITAIGAAGCGMPV